jgi:hypothetical protein
MFSGFEKVRIRTSAWDTSKKDVIGGKQLLFLVIKISSKGDAVTEYRVDPGGCFRSKVAGRSCEQCGAAEQE